MRLGIVMMVLWMVAPGAVGQTSSLYFENVDVPGYTPNAYTPASPRKNLSPAIAAMSLMAVSVPEPRTFAVGNLVTVIIRESTKADWSSTLDTKKNVTFDGKVTSFPAMSFADLAIRNGIGTPIDLGVSYGNKFKGNGDMTRKESITGRVTARIIDVKPNGTLALEATKYNQVDKETMRLVLSGLCRSEDISIDNTILSSQIYDFHLVKEHTGELRKATRKGILTQVIELLFNF